MGAAAEKLKYTYAEYLELDRESEYKLEYEDGEIYPLGEILAMGGGTRQHSKVGARIISALAAQMAQRPCEIYNSEQRIKVLATGFAVYPDASVVCGREEIDPDDAETITNPVLIVEVLSKSTEKRDRGTKWTHYRLIPSLRDYLIISQKEPHIEHYARNADGSWTLRDIMPPDKVRLSAGGEIDLVDLYRERLAL